VFDSTPIRIHLERSEDSVFDLKPMKIHLERSEVSVFDLKPIKIQLEKSKSPTHFAVNTVEPLKEIIEPNR